MRFPRNQISGIWKKIREDHIVPIAIILGFMCLWRCGLGSLSSRYWASVWIPLLLLGSWLLFCNPLGLRLSRILAVVLIGICIGKDFRFNRNNSAIIHASDAILQDARQFSRVFLADSNHSGIFSRVSFYTELPTFPAREGLPRELAVLCYSAQGLYDACYYVTDDGEREHKNSQEMLAALHAEQIFVQNKDMHGKKKIYVYRVRIPQQQAILPVNGEIWPNGEFEKIYQRGDFFFPEHYAPCVSANPNCTVKEGPDTISGRYSFYCRSAGRCFTYSDLVSPPPTDGTIVLTVKSSRMAVISLSIWKFDRKGVLLSRKTVLDAVLPDEALQHQFHIPFSAKDYLDADKIRCYFDVHAPYGVLLDDFGFVAQNSSASP